jgi:hypothetical protein
VRASFQSGILSLIALAQGFCAEQKTTASGEAIPDKEGNIEMLWIAIAASLIFFGLFLYFPIRKVVKKIERDIFF